jgi:hypothetical protein
MVMVFIPSTRLISGVDHCVVPIAAPTPAVELLQDTDATATLSEAVPLKTMLGTVVAIVVDVGDVMLRVGAVVSGVEEMGAA